MAKPMAEILRDAIRKSGYSGLALSKRTGVPQERISGFLRGHNIRLAYFDKLADFFGLALQPKRSERATRREAQS
jgi:hypothetical protein